MDRPPPPFADEVGLAAIIAAFDAASLPQAAWTHAAHLSVGTCAVMGLGPQEALPYLRDGIRRLNRAHGVVNSATGGYHETVTWLYIAVIAGLLADLPAGRPRHVQVAAIIAGPVDVLARRHYSHDLLWSGSARVAFVDGDLMALPMVPRVAG